MKMTVIIFSLLSTLGIFCSALEASSYTDRDNNANLDYAANSRSSQYLPMKRYTYVSEYKRLPLYNFGIGKVFNKIFFFFKLFKSIVDADPF